MPPCDVRNRTPLCLIVAIVGVAWHEDCAHASPEGTVAAAYVTVDTYREILDHWLYTHDGDDRGFGPQHDMARDNIIALFTAYGLTVTLESFEYPEESGDIYYNVVGTKVGTVYPMEEFIIGAHFDSVSNPGADDNASGTALVLEAARVISAYPSDYTIRFIAFDREEQGLIGSEAYVAAHHTDDIIGMISADMVAYNTGLDRAEVFGRTLSTTLRNAVGDAVVEYGGGLTAGLLGGSGGSDHLPFELAGIPGVLFIEDWGNPYYHSPEDSVDTPNYIDYDYATRMTRSIVGFLVDNAGVAVDLPDADYDSDGFVGASDFDVLTTCYTGSGNAPTLDCTFFDLDGDNDVDCADWDIFEALWTGPGDPPIYWTCITLPPFAGQTSARCLHVALPDHELPVAVRVQGAASDPQVSCLAAYVQADGTLGPAPLFRMYNEWGQVNICDIAVVPEAAYEVLCDYGQSGAPSLSSAVDVTTPRFGDTVGMFSGGSWSPPNGIIEIGDVVAILERFKNVSSAPPAMWVDLVGAGTSGLSCAPDGAVDIVDAVAALDAFRGRTFLEFPGCTLPCP